MMAEASLIQFGTVAFWAAMGEARLRPITANVKCLIKYILMKDCVVLGTLCVQTK